MRRLLVSLTGALALCALAAAGASAAPGSGAATPFKATYVDSALGATATCSGAHIEQTNGATAGTIKDSETCIISGDTSSVPTGTIVGDPNYTFPALGNTQLFWQSDYNGLIASHVTLTFTPNGDGTYTEEVVAYY